MENLVRFPPKRVSQGLAILGSGASIVIKRAFDVVVAFLGLILLAPVFVFISILIRNDSPGPVFYRGLRAGKGCKPFHIIKFRTMYERPESYRGPRVTGKDDIRVTRLGRWLRQTKINELPQLWNVIKGDMSLVGPRPEDYQIALEWPEDVQREVLSVRPGLTSPASVVYRREEEQLSNAQVMDQYLLDILPSKLRLDQLYVRYRSFWLDLDILFWTFMVLLPRVGDYAPPENLLFIGPITRLIQRYINWFFVDAAITFLSIGVVGVIWRWYGPLNVGLPAAVMVAVGFAFLFSLTGALLGVNRISWSRASMFDALDLLPAIVVAILVAILINRLAGDLDPTRAFLPEGMLLVSAFVSYSGFILARYRGRVFSGLFMRWLAWRGAASGAQERVLIVGGGEAAQFAAWWLQSGFTTAFHIIGCVDDDLTKQGMRIHGMNVLGKTDSIAALVEKHDIGLIIYAIHNITPEQRQSLLKRCAATPARMMEMPNILDALRAAVRHERWQDGEQPEVLAEMLDEISRGQINAWLSELEEMLEDGDLEHLQERLHYMKKVIGQK